jgi:hypothetical protein
MGDNDSVVVLIPKGFRLIAETEWGKCVASVYQNKDEKTFLLVLDHERAFGPMKAPQLETVHHVINDVIEMRGKFIYLE